MLLTSESSSQRDTKTMAKTKNQKDNSTKTAVVKKDILDLSSLPNPVKNKNKKDEDSDNGSDNGSDNDTSGSSSESESDSANELSNARDRGCV